MSIKNLSYSLCVFLPLCLLLLLSACERLPLDAAVKAENGQSPESRLAQTLSRKSGRITVIGNDGNIYTLNQTGDDIVSITADANFSQLGGSASSELIKYLLPTWSIVGQKLAFVRQELSKPGEKDFALAPELRAINIPQQENPERALTFEILIKAADSSEIKSLWQGTARPIYLYWSPDGTHVTALLQEGPSPDLRLILLPVGDTAPSASVLDVGSPLFWDWASHGNQLITHIGSQRLNEKVSILDLVDGVSEEILDVNPMPFMAPDISPDGSSLALPIRADEAGDDDTWVAIYNLADRSRKIIDRLDGEAYISLNYSPDGNKIAYIASDSTDGGNAGELVIYNLRNGEQIISDEKNISAFFWSPDSEKIAWFETLKDNENGSKGVFVFDINQREKVPLIEGFETTAEFNEVLSFFSQYQRSATIWSPNSLNLVIPIASTEKTEIKVVHAGGGILPRTLALGTLAFWSAE